MSPEPLIELPAQPLADFVVAQRWFGSKSRTPASIGVRAAVEIHPADPRIDVALLEVSYDDGGEPELYQLPIGERAVGDPALPAATIDADDARVLYDAATDPALAGELARRMREGSELRSGAGVARFAALEGFDVTGESARALGVEQSNTSIVLDGRVALKVLRHLAPGINPEVEMLRFLTERGFAHIPALRGWYAYEEDGLDVTLGVAQDFVAGSRDGWAIALEVLGGPDPMAFEATAHRLGSVTGELHATLARNADDVPDFAPEELTATGLASSTVELSAAIEEVMGTLPAGDARLDPVRGRGGELRARLRALAGSGSAGRAIRHHGDYHLGQVIRGGDGRWAILDFEGEPARSLAERRAKRSPLRDVAGMLRSFAYAAAASRIQAGVEAPLGWERAMRDAFLAGYTDEVDPTLLPEGAAAVDRVIAIFELEKLIYELGYELDHRPDWVGIPVAGIVRLLDPETEEAS